MTFLLVTDAPGASETIQEPLEEDGHSCLIARDVEDADWTLDVAVVHALALDVDAPGKRPALDWLEELSRVRPRLTRRTVVLTSRPLAGAELRQVRTCGAGVLELGGPVEELRDAMLERIRTEEALAPARRRRSASGSARAARKDDELESEG